MESNRYRVAQVIGAELPPEAQEHIEKAMRGNLLRELEGVLFSGETVAVKIEREEETRWMGGRRVGYTAHIQQVQQVRQVEYTLQYPKRRKSKKQRIAEKRAALKRNRERKAALRKRVRA